MQANIGTTRSPASRVWVPGCASGEEFYTLAIVLKELTGEHPIEIVATDLNPERCWPGATRAFID